MIVPIAGVILTFVMCYELIQLVTEKNNLHDVDTWMFFKWIFKTFCAVLIVTNTWNIVMIIVMLPFFLLAMYERHGQPLEVVAGQVIRCMFLRTKERPYQTNNFYSALERQAQTEKEVKAIVQKAKARAAGTTDGKTRGKADRHGKA